MAALLAEQLRRERCAVGLVDADRAALEVGPNHSDDPRYVRVFVASLRRKIEPQPARPRYLLTEQGVGALTARRRCRRRRAP